MRWPRTSGSAAPAPRWTGSSGTSKLYLALNGAVHDAAIAAWGLKGHYDSARPISLIRYMGGKGQSSDPAQPAYDPEGLPLVPGLVEVITSDTTAPGQRHAALEGHEGEIAVRAWQAYPEDPKADTAGVGWMPGGGVGPVPADDVRDAGVPGLRLGPQHVQPRRGRGDGGLHRERVLPGRRERLHGARRARSSSRAGRRPTSRSSGRPTSTPPTRPVDRVSGAGSTSRADDLTGREIGSEVGIEAWNAARRYFDGTAGS